MWAVLVALLVASVFFAGAICAVRAAQTARTPQGAVGWVVFLLTAPLLAVPAYLMLGQHRYRGYHTTRRESAKIMKRIQDFTTAYAPDGGGAEIPTEPFEYCANLPALRGNRARVLIDGPETFDAIFSAIDAATSYVLVQFYTVQDDRLGRELQQCLIAAAQRGVLVRFMTDAVGSRTLPEAYKTELRSAGVNVAGLGTARGPHFRFQINFRNHRKTVIVDGTTGFTGGLNVGDEYMGKAYLGKESPFGDWRDTHVQLFGPMVSQLQLIFAEDWHWLTGELLIDQMNWKAPLDPRNATGLIVATGPGDETETGSLMFFSAISAARERVWIATPYFVPDLDIITALRHAALRGVDVRILVPDVMDHRLPWLAAFSYFDDIREAGVRVFRYTQGFMHQKVIVVDSDLAAVGTTNLDNRSFRLNFEAMALFFEEQTVAEIDRMLRDDFTRSSELTRTLDLQPAYVRYGAPLARLFSPLL